MSVRSLLLICALIGQALAEGPVPVILDTDLGPDCDDAGAIAVLHALAGKGEARILGIMCNTTSEWCAPSVDAINTWYGRPDVPVGTLKRPGNAGGGPAWFGESFNRFLTVHSPNRLGTGTRAPDALALYRKLLLAAPDASVVIASTGNTTNLRDVIESPGGLDLVRRKVRLLSVMGGTYPHGSKPDPNLNGDPGASRAVLERWPAPIVFSGTEIGDRILTGAALSTATPAGNPVRLAYELWDDHFWRIWDPGFDAKRIQPHPSYDQTAVLYAVRGLRDYWTAKTGGVTRLRGDGSTEWSAAPNRGHSYLVESMPASELARIIEGLMTEPPARGPGSAPPPR